MPNAQEKQAIADRQRIQGQGDILNQQAQDRSRNDTGKRDFYNQYADQVYDPLISGQGGYTPEEAAGIQQTEALDALQPNQQDLQGNYLTPDEINSIQGSPWDRAKFFNPGKTSDIANQGAENSNAAVAGMKSDLYSAINPDSLRLSQQFKTDQDAALQQGEDTVRGDINHDALTTDQGTLDSIRMSPEEQQRIVTAAGTTVGNATRAANDDLHRRAAAAGVDPLGERAMAERDARLGGGQQADAMTSARIAADNAAAERAVTAENLRRSGEQNYADLASGADMGLSGRRLAQGNTTEGMRLSSEQDLSSRGMTAATTAGDAAVGVQKANADRNLGTEQQNQATGTAIATGIEKDTSDRAGAVAANRQGTARANQNQNYTQGMGIAQQKSAGAGKVADQQQATQQEGRQYLTGQQAGWNTNAQNEYNRQAGIYGTEGGLTNQATGNQITASGKPSTFDKVVGAGVGALGAVAPFLEEGGVVTEPTQAILGEKGPEMVIPLNGRGGGAGMRMGGGAGMDPLADSQGPAPAPTPTGLAGPPHASPAASGTFVSPMADRRAVSPIAGAGQPPAGPSRRNAGIAAAAMGAAGGYTGNPMAQRGAQNFSQQMSGGGGWRPGQPHPETPNEYPRQGGYPGRVPGRRPMPMPRPPQGPQGPQRPMMFSEQYNPNRTPTSAAY